MRTAKTLLVLVAAISVLFTGCKNPEPPKPVQFKKAAMTPNPPAASAKPLRIAIGAMITPKEGLVYYRSLLDYIGERVGRPVKYVDKDNYADINKLLESGGLDAAFVCSGPYVEGHRKFGLELVAVPRVNGGTVYYSYFIVSAKSPISKFEELRGRSFAFTDPLSNTGALVPTYVLSRMGETPVSFFKKLYYSHGHDKSIEAVALGLVDGAAVDSLIWEYANKKNPKYTSMTRIIFKSPPYGIPPFVVSNALDPATKGIIRDVLLNAYTDEKGKAILNSMNIERFVPIGDEAYDSVRDMAAWIEKQKQKKK